MKRVESWEKILAKFIEDRVESELVWGVQDCCLFACDSILSITGEDVAGFFRGKYSTKEKAYELLFEFAGGGLLETVEKITDQFKMIRHPSIFYAQRGDVIYSEIETCLGGIRGTLGIMGMNGSIVIPGKDRLEFIPLEKGLIAWKV